MAHIAYVVVAAILCEATVTAVTKVTRYALRHGENGIEDMDTETGLWLCYLLLVAATFAAIMTRGV